MAWYRCGGTPSEVLSLPTTSEASGAIARFNTDLTENLLSAVAEFSATQASGTPTPANPIPIVGVDKVNVTLRTGVNLWNELWEVGTIQGTDGKDAASTTQYRTIGFIPLPDNESVYLYNGANNIIGLRYYDQNKNYIGNRAATTSKELVRGSLDLPNNAKYLRFCNASTPTYANNISINYPSTETTYHAFVGTTALINLGGTYYGGSVDAVTGKITLTHQLISYTGSADENWSILNQGDTSQRFRFNPAYSGMSLVTCSHCQLINTNTANWGYCRFENNYFVLTDSDNQMGSVENLKTWLATQHANGKPLSILVELETPIVVYASNTAEIPTIVGDNQVYADTGDVAVKYFETVGHKI